MNESGVSVEKNTQRRWTDEEDKLLVKFLMEMHSEGKWKAESGFKSGYLTHLQKLFATSMPEAELKVSNIDSRLSYLRKRFNALQDIKQKGSGFGWDDSQKMVTGDRKLFEDWAKSHKEAKGMFRKPFPLYDDLEVIYSKDRATGLKATMPADKDDAEAVQDNIQEDIEVIELSKGDEVSNEASGTSKRIISESTSKNQAKKKMRKNKELQNIAKSMETMMEKMIEGGFAQIDKLASMMEDPKDMWTGLHAELRKVPGISRAQALSLTKKMVDKDVVIFRDLDDDDDKYDFLTMILEGK